MQIRFCWVTISGTIKQKCYFLWTQIWCAHFCTQYPENICELLADFLTLCLSLLNLVLRKRICWMSCLAVLTHCCVIPGLPLVCKTLSLVFPTAHVINSQKEQTEFSLKILSAQVLRCPSIFFLPLCFLITKVKARARKILCQDVIILLFRCLQVLCQEDSSIKLHLVI